MAKRRKFSKEFKHEAVQMATGASLSIKQVATDLGIHTNVLSRWCREQNLEGPKAFQGQGIPRDEEMAKLKRELARVKRERDFLKDAAVFFARDTPRGMP
jgi:transposase